MLYPEIALLSHGKSTWTDRRWFYSLIYGILMYMKIPTKKCRVCKSKFENARFDDRGIYKTWKWPPERWVKAKFCSHLCRYEYQKGKPSNKKGTWTSMTYSAVHKWIRATLGPYPKKCQFCGEKGKKNGRCWSIHYANKSGKYLREVTDWLRLCTRCHRKHDKHPYVLKNTKRR